jgi:hypothetical protein
VSDLLSGHAFRTLTALAIVLSTAACDNVAWGGVDVRFVRAPSALDSLADSADANLEPGGFTLPSGPVLYMGTRDSTGIYLVPVGEIQKDSLSQFRTERSAPGYRAAFARELMPTGSRFTLFSAGSRVGTFTVGEVGTDDSYCTARPRASGVVELVPGAADATRFLALPEESTKDMDYQPYRPLESDRVQRSAGIDLAGAVIPQLGATWPTSMVEARGDLAVATLDGRPAVSTTFVFRDQMAIQPAQPTSYSLYLLATPDGERYRTAYVWYRQAASEGKGAPRFFESMDWDGDGKTEVLLEVLGERSRWPAVIEERGSEWTRTYEDACGVATPVAAPAPR